MTGLEYSQQKKLDGDSKSIDSDVFSHSKFWIKRIKFDTHFKFSYLVLYISAVSILVYLTGFYLTFTSNLLLVTTVEFGVTIFALYLGKKIPKNFQKSVDKIDKILKPEVYKKYIPHIKRKFNSKLELILPFIFAVGIVIFLIMTIMISGSINMMGLTITPSTGSSMIATLKGETFILEGLSLVLTYICGGLLFIMLIICLTLAISAIFIIYNAFSSINLLGTDDFPLKVTYEDLKIGAFDELGRFIIATNIPVITFASSISMVGLYQIFFINDLVMGFLLVMMGFFISILLAILLYRDTIHIHDSIIKHKKRLKKKTIRKIQELLGDSEDTSKDINFSEIETIHHFYNEVLDIKDWPFNPTSVKKLVITLGSSFIPLLLSLFGFM